MLSRQMKSLKPSPTLALAAKAKALKGQGLDVISLTVGEPDWPTYPKAKQAGIQAINDNKTTYTPASGINEIKSAIAGLVGPQLGCEIQLDQITVASGAKFIIFAALNAILDPGDEVIIPSPYWVSYPTMVELAQGVPKIIDCGEEQDFKLTPQQLAQAIGPRTKAVLLNSPSNPTGAEYSKEELASLAQVLKENKHVVILSDDIYNQLSFSQDSLSPHILNVEPSLFERCISINGVSKAYSMTGWRIGWAVGPAEVIKAMGSYQSQTTGAPSSISQWASVAAINHCAKDVAESLGFLKERKDYFISLLEEIPGLSVFAPQGAFYAWVGVKDWLNKTYKGEVLKDSRDVASQLLEKQLLAVVPGLEFGLEGYLRLSFAASRDDLLRASQRLAQFQSELV
jgi:aspartate aminotransferase